MTARLLSVAAADHWHILRDVLPDRDHRLSEGRKVEGSAMDFWQSDCHANQRLQIAIEPATPVAR
jgi:hypothetical protein